MPNNVEFKKRLESEAKAAMPIRNKDLDCKNCIYKYDDSEKFGNTSVCKIYEEGKPNEVLAGGKCMLKFKEEE